MAIVVSSMSVLIGRRRDGNQPWTFPVGKIEPGESPKLAAVGETLEETGLRVRAIGVISNKVHPLTGVSITYVAAVLASEAEVPIREDPASPVGGELTEVRWLSLAEAGELMGDMAEDGALPAGSAQRLVECPRVVGAKNVIRVGRSGTPLIWELLQSCWWCRL